MTAGGCSSVGSCASCGMPATTWDDGWQRSSWRAWFVAGSPAHAACGDAMGVDPDLQRDHSTDEIGVEIANVALMGDKPCKVIQIPGCRSVVEARDLLGDVLLQSPHLKLRHR